ncbi:iron(III) dicitrate transport ATP-binding protein FecE [Treponema primitia ZAS-2]|uniref:Iron(III) dicitrate transport ATP-binding protein FecE n=1 Tax=Treponema primitia (strain ATCC BAA-887 / DSM 12427 / ZAS-2) TaxID=545694 RepID=F5YMZ7_TREPZ|nr:ABC transporter substrate-binding protein [Treponema primitia]AEF85396.1 iron(III) dicitrate transport ATP-binding protein FecE [Treponema primitia ZAS-2]
MKKFFVPMITVLFLFSSVSVFSSPRKDTAQPASGSTITDLAGRQLTLKTPVNKVVALAGPSYEKVFLLGQASRLVGAHFYMVDRPWVIATNPGIAKVTPVRSPAEPNVEALLALGTDCVLFWDYADALKNLENAGLPTVVVQQSVGNPQNTDEFIAYQKREVQVFADVLGPEAQAKAKTWFDYFDQKVAYVQGRITSIPASQRKTAIYAYGEEGLGVFSQYSYVSYWLQLAGGRNIADETGMEMDTEVTMEQVIAWDPDLIFMGRMDSADPVLHGTTWAQLKAVKNNDVYICPDGVMYWDYSSEGVLLMLFLAQKMYPDLFTELDMVAETQGYYQKFYSYSLSAENARQLLNHLPPQ